MSEEVTPEANLLEKATPLAKEKAPKDHGFVWVVSLILGVGTLLAYNMMVTASDFLTTEYPDYPNIMFWVIPAYSVPNVIFTFLMIVYGDKFSFTTRIVWGFVTTAVVVGLVPFFATQFGHSRADETVSYDLVMGICGFIGFSAAVLQATTIGFTNLLPPKYTQANIAGQSVAGILACIVRIVTKAAEPDDKQGYVSGGWVYFIAGAVGSVICAISFVYVMRTVFVKHHLQGYMSRKKVLITQQAGDTVSAVMVRENTQMILKLVADEEQYGDEMKAESDINVNVNVSNSFGPVSSGAEEDVNNIKYHLTTQHDKEAEALAAADEAEQALQAAEANKEARANGAAGGYAVVWRKISKPAIALFLMFMVTFLIFPGLMTGIESQYSLGDWMSVILVTEFNIGDYVGRQFVASWTSFGMTADTLWIGCVLRILLYPLFVVLYKGYIVSDVLTHAAVIVFSITNGHFCCLSFIFTPGLVNKHEQEACAAIMSSALVSGIFAGSAISLAITQGICKDFFG